MSMLQYLVEKPTYVNVTVLSGEPTYVNVIVLRLSQLTSMLQYFV
jgi:hypothetical protein